jgi:hypothetical protein
MIPLPMRKSWLGLVIAFACLLTVGFAQATSTEYKPVEKSPDTHAAFISHIDRKEDGRYKVTADYIDWYEGEAANEKFRELENDPEMIGVPDGYYIVNDSDELRTLEIAADATILMQIYNRTGNVADADIVWNEPITLDKFISLINADEDWNMKDYPYHLTLKDGIIVKIVQQYTP